MSVLVVGISHTTAPVGMVERVYLDAAGVAQLRRSAVASPHVAEAFVVATCNRLEIFADVSRFHVGVETLTALLATHTGVPVADLTPHLDVRYEDRAARHLFALACGLESMVVGETQILGQVRSALRDAQDDSTVGGVLGGLAQQALRVGKRAHTETGIAAAARSLVSAGLDVAGPQLGGLDARRAVVVGAGSMARLAAVLLHRAGCSITVVNRTPEHAAGLAASVGGATASPDDLAAVIARADLVVSCTGSPGVVIGTDTVKQARELREEPLVLVDLAMPHDVDPRVAELPHVKLVGLAQLAELRALHGDAPDREADAVRAIVDEEVETYLCVQRAERVSPTIVALRARAAEVAGSEVARLEARLGGLDPVVRTELGETVRRAFEKLLHEPTVRMKELATEKGGDQYADALRRLFDLDVPGERPAVPRFEVPAPPRGARPDAVVTEAAPAAASSDLITSPSSITDAVADGGAR